MRALNSTLITGASEGIGRCFAEEFAKHGHDLIQVARKAEKLKVLATELQINYQVKVSVYPCDLTQADAIDSLYQQILADGGLVDILVNNAGVMCVDDFVYAEPNELERLLQLNIQALVNMTRTFLPDMVLRESGKVVNIGSVASFIPTPKFAVYGASKAFVLSFSEALSEEVKEIGVAIHCVCPGFTHTQMLMAGKGLETIIPQFLKVPPESLVRDAYKAIMKGETLYVDKFHNKLLVQWAQLYPRWLVRGVSGFLSRLKD
ncbi:MAG: SDR family NAD(P)-dependent oxidoreductase [Aestuariibacter sp.]